MVAFEGVKKFCIPHRPDTLLTRQSTFMFQPPPTKNKQTNKQNTPQTNKQTKQTKKKNRTNNETKQQTLADYTTCRTGLLSFKPVQA